MAESRSCIRTAIVSSVWINTRQCTCINITAHGGISAYHGIIWSSQNVGKLSACANSGYQAPFSDISNGPGYEAKFNAAATYSSQLHTQFTYSNIIYTQLHIAGFFPPLLLSFSSLPYLPSDSPFAFPQFSLLSLHLPFSPSSPLHFLVSLLPLHFLFFLSAPLPNPHHY